ncbi:hypothetical protein [Corynebacterium gallinarum]|uniref:Transmembrane protein n=1 Tax=Corynebacterium gallinarum TaxID=2762214 RepID=A0A8I0LBU0_9CORY|nr:hypothetical protein [Corynebacterium gallinarum]MBD8029626.1 hypothetical protein [Corynebacterium gallinarum]
MSESHASYIKAAPERLNYIDGYTPVSYTAPHSSLERGTTWTGMGLLLVSLAGLGAVLFGLGANSVGTQTENWLLYTVIGAVFFVITGVIGSVLIWKGRAPYRKYVKETGREH